MSSGILTPRLATVFTSYVSPQLRMQSQELCWLSDRRMYQVKYKLQLLLPFIHPLQNDAADYEKKPGNDPQAYSLTDCGTDENMGYKRRKLNKIDATDRTQSCKTGMQLQELQRSIYRAVAQLTA